MYVAVEKEVEDANSREIIITSLAKANANEACKKVIMSLPFDPPPTLT